MSRSIGDLDPRIQERAHSFIRELQALGFRYSILETRRSPLVQRAYYAQGREPLNAINKKRADAGLYLLGEAEGKRIITWTRKSLHLDGFALDVVPVNSNGSIPWSIKDATIAARWMALGEVGERHGFEWGGRWTPLNAWGLGRDLPHFQITVDKI
jgi:hypothetical protein